jgi:hypothetical protein
MRPFNQGCALRWRNGWAFGPHVVQRAARLGIAKQYT